MLRGLGTYIRRHHVALLALFITLGGTASAATGYPANIIGTKQLKNNAVTSAKVADNSLTGADILESSLGKVPSAANSDQLGGSAASTYQHTLQGACPLGGAYEAIGSDGEGACIVPVKAITATPTAGNNVFQNLGHGLQVATVCHDGGQVKIAFQNIGSASATLNWFYSDGTAVNAAGAVLAASTGEQDFSFLGKRLEGQFIFANGDGNTTVSLHAFDGTTFCETRGTAQFGPNS